MSPPIGWSVTGQGLSMPRRGGFGQMDMQLRAAGAGLGHAVSEGQNIILNWVPTIRGSLVNAVRLLKSMAPTVRIWFAQLRQKPATSYLPSSQM